MPWVAPRRAFLSLALLTAVSAACGSDDFPRTAEEIQARVRALRLAEAPVSGGVLARDTRILLTPQGIDVDNAALFTGWSLKSRSKFRSRLPSAQADDVPLIARAAVRLTAWKPVPEHAPPPGALDLPVLRPILDRAAAIDRANSSSRDITLRLYAPEDAPYGLVARTLATAAAAGYADLRLAVRNAGGEAEIFHQANPQIGELRTCYPLWISLSPAGATLRLLPRNPTSPGLVAPAPPPPLSGATQGPSAVLSRPIRSPDRACPTVPRRAGRHDLDALAARLKEIRDSGLSCSYIGVVANESAPWSEVAPVLESSRPLPFISLALGAPIADSAADPDCATAVELEEIVGVLSKNREKEFWSKEPF